MSTPVLADRATVRAPSIGATVHAHLWSTPLRASLTITVLWRMALALVGILTPLFHLPGRPVFSLLRAEHWSANPLTLAVSSGVQNDSVWYGITTLHGYSRLWMSNFFPLLPALAKAVSVMTGGDIWVAGLVVANAAFVAAVVLLNAWLKLRGQDRYSPLATALLLVNPGAIFFGFMYAESLYLALLLGALVAYERQRYVIASVCALLLALTRPTGFLIVVIFVLWAVRKRDGRALLPVAGTLLGVASYAVFQFLKFGTPLAELQQTQQFGTPRTLAQGIKDLTLQASPGHPVSALVLLLATALLYLTAVRLVYRYHGLEYAVLAGTMVVFPALTGLASYQRYASVAFMVPVAVAVWGNRRVIFSWLVWSLWFTIAAAALFTTGLVF